jgi:hypothetical protein
MNWQLIWQIVFVSILVLFAVMAVMTTIFGARDVKKLLKELDEDIKKDDDDSTK